MVPVSQCKNCKGRGHYSLDCPLPQRENRCDQCKRALSAGFSCGPCRADVPERAQIIRVAPALQRPWMRLSAAGKLSVPPKYAARCAEWTNNGDFKRVQIFQPTAAFVSSDDWRMHSVHPKIVQPCNCAQCAPPLALLTPPPEASPKEVLSARQIRDFVRKLAGDANGGRIEFELDTGGTLTVVYEPPEAPAVAAAEPSEPDGANEPAT